MSQVFNSTGGTGGGAPLATVAPPTVGSVTASVVGVSANAAREDHTHGHANVITYDGATTVNRVITPSEAGATQNTLWRFGKSALDALKFLGKSAREWFQFDAPVNFTDLSINPKSYGVVGDGVADDTVALNLFVQALKNSGKAIRGQIPAGTYKISDTIYIDTPCEFSADNNAWSQGSVLFNSSNPFKPALWVTSAATSPNGTTGASARISGVWLTYTGTAAAVWAPTTAHALGACVLSRAYTSWDRSTAYTIGDKRTNGANVYVVTTGGTSSGAATGPTGVGSGISDGSVTWDFYATNRANNTYVFEVTTGGTSAATEPNWSSLTAAGQTIVSGTVTYTSRQGGGIMIDAPVSVENTNVRYFPGNGVHIEGNSGASTNANLFKLRNVTAAYNQMNGFWADGSDSNAGWADNCDATQNGRYGVYDSSGAGNVWHVHASANVLGPGKADDANSQAMALGWYTESGAYPPLDWNGSIVGGTHGAGIFNGANARVTGGQSAIDRPFTIRNTIDQIDLAINIASGGSQAGIFNANQPAASELFGLKYGGSGSLASSWNFHTAFADVSTSLAFTASGHAWGTGVLWLAPGKSYFRMADTTQRIASFFAATPPATLYRAGDFGFNYYSSETDGSSLLGVIGYSYTAASDKSPFPLRATGWGWANQRTTNETVGSPYAIVLRADAGMLFHNWNAGAMAGCLLPSLAGLATYEPPFVEYSFYCDDADGIRITAQGTATIRCQNYTTAAAGYLESKEPGSYITIKCLAGSLFWYVSRISGTWTDGTFTHSTTQRLTATTSDITLTMHDAFGETSNAGAAGTVILTLPTPTAGKPIVFDFHVRAAQILRVKMPGGVTIRWANLVSGAAGYIQSDNIGAHLTIKSYSATEYEVTNLTGIWAEPV